MTKQEFFERCQPEPMSGCWIWVGGSTDKDGYGRCTAKINGVRYQRAHRLSWRLFNGKKPDLYVCHRCDNPLCVNPDHLFLGTPKQNFHDCIAKGRMPKKTHCKRGHLIIPENQTYLSNGSRRCRLCHAVREGARYGRNRKNSNGRDSATRG